MRSFLVVALVTTAFGFMQFFVDPYFFRYGVERSAFGGMLRANGIFSTDHIQAYFLVSAFFLTLFILKKGPKKYFLLGMFFTGIVLSFHRASLLITILLIILYIYKIKGGAKTLMIGSIVVVSCLMILSSTLPIIERTSFYQERLSEDTGTYRMFFVYLAINSIPNHFLTGIGSTETNEYYTEVSKSGFGEKAAMGAEGGIHNTYLLLAYLKGVPVALIFIVFLISAIVFFWKISKEKSGFYLVVFEILKFALASLTNQILLGSETGLLLAIFMGAGIAIYRKQNLRERINEENLNIVF
jgi:hypothetical protein